MKNGGWRHPLDGDIATAWESVPVEKKPGRTDKELDAIWRPRAKRWRERGISEVARLAQSLGVSVAALKALHTGWDGKAWTFPEKNGDGLVIGVTRRFLDGAKRCAVGSRRGLTYYQGWRLLDGPVLIVEGASDVAAGLTMCIPTIGRPSNVGGLPMLIRLLRGSKRNIVVIGERDKKENGQWPGMEGAKKTAMGLGKGLRRSIGAKLMPDGAKDMRGWLNGCGLSAAETHKELVRYFK
jgi:hypothetical protein